MKSAVLGAKLAAPADLDKLAEKAHVASETNLDDATDIKENGDSHEESMHLLGVDVLRIVAVHLHGVVLQVVRARPLYYCSVHFLLFVRFNHDQDQDLKLILFRLSVQMKSFLAVLMQRVGGRLSATGEGLNGNVAGSTASLVATASSADTATNQDSVNRNLSIIS